MQRVSSMPQAIAHIRGDGIRGMAQFWQIGRYVRIQVQVRGLPGEGFFALHIHEGSACSGSGFPLTGGHYNPTGVPHPMHAGDLPPLLSCGGRAWLTVLSDRFRLPEIIGRTVIIHSGPDDFHTQPAGNPGTKIACGVIHRT